MADPREAFSQHVFRALGHHFVSLSCVERLSNGDKKLLVFSGFLADVLGSWFYVTAGHILRDIRAALAAGATFDVWRLSEMAINPFHGIAIPFHFDDQEWMVACDESRGLDYAAIALEPMYCLQLQAGNARPLDKPSWGDHTEDHDEWALVGIPSTSVTYDGVTKIAARFVGVPVKCTDQEPASAGPKSENQFYAHLPPNSLKKLGDPDGMSGSPVFALKKVDEQWRYKVIGVQSGYYEQSGLISICPFSSFGFAMEEVVREVRDHLAGSLP